MLAIRSASASAGGGTGTIVTDKAGSRRFSAAAADQPMMPPPATTTSRIAGVASLISGRRHRAVAGDMADMVGHPLGRRPDFARAAPPCRARALGRRRVGAHVVALRE